MHLTVVRKDPQGRVTWKKLCRERGVPFIVVHRQQNGCKVEWEGVAELSQLDALITEGEAEYGTEGGRVRGLTPEAATTLAARLFEILKPAPATV